MQQIYFLAKSKHRNSEGCWSGWRVDEAHSLSLVSCNG